MANTLFLKHPREEKKAYNEYRDAMRKELRPLTKEQANAKLRYEMGQSHPEVTDHERDVSRKMISELYEMHAYGLVPDSIKAILDSTAGTTGSVLIRQDLEPLLYQLFVIEFPLWEMLASKPANGLVHAFNQITQAASGSTLFGTVLSTELSNVAFTRSNFVRQTAPVAVFATGRGSSFKELAAVRQGGVTYDVLGTELADGMVNLATDAQAMVFQGNASNNTGTATNEGGLFGTSFFDGWRDTLGSFQTFNTNNAIQVDAGGLSIMEGIQNGAAQARNNGGRPTLVTGSMNFKQALDTELQANKRYTDNMTVGVGGMQFNSIMYADGNLTVLPVPGTTIGSYNRTSDGVLVEDIYVISEKYNSKVWLYSEGWTVLEIPAGVDTQLSNRYIVD